MEGVEATSGGGPAKLALPPHPEAELPVPHVEWWDVPFLPGDKRQGQVPTAGAGCGDLAAQNSKFFKLVLHPLPVKPTGHDKMKEPELPVYLTKQERKRIRRQARQERGRELQDKIALGLVAAPEPKLKLGNFMKVLGDQAVADPSKMERKVMEQVKARQLNHEMRNLARKLTPAELKAKRQRKLAEDTTLQTHVALFRVKDLGNLQHQYKVDVNAQQLSLTGGVLQCLGQATDGCTLTLVLVEGGPKAIKRYVKLMLRRIKWNGDEFGEEDSEEEDEYGGGGEAQDATNTHF